MMDPVHHRGLARASVVDSLDAITQETIVDQVRSICRASPLVRYRTPNGLQMSVRVTSAGDLGWVGDGAYRYTPVDAQGQPWPEMPILWWDIANRVAGPQPWDSAIINWYEPGTSLGWHRDLSEVDRRRPIVTFSIGDSCSWAMRLEENSPISRTRLDTGDVTLLAGPTRLALHMVEKIVPNPLFSPLRVRGRLSVTVRVAG